jgi:hypothetical protein
MDDLFALFSPLLAAIMAILVLYGLVYLGRVTGDWRFYSLASIPIAFLMLYFYVRFFAPPIEHARAWLRLVLIFSFANASHAIITFILKLKREDK